MAVFQTVITVLFAALALVAIAMAAILYYSLFIAIMVVWDGCEICRRIRQGEPSNTDHGQSLSRT